MCVMRVHVFACLVCCVYLYVSAVCIVWSLSYATQCCSLLYVTISKIVFAAPHELQFSKAYLSLALSLPFVKTITTWKYTFSVKWAYNRQNSKEMWACVYDLLQLNIWFVCDIIFLSLLLSLSIHDYLQRFRNSSQIHWVAWKLTIEIT